MGPAGKIVDITDPSLRRLHAYWRDLRGDRFAPPRAAIDPLELRFILGNLAIVEVREENGRRVYHCRLMGTRLADQDGFDLTGKPLESYPFPEQREVARDQFDAVVRDRQPAYREVRSTESGKLFRFGRLVLPLSDDGERVDGLLIGRIFLEPGPPSRSL